MLPCPAVGLLAAQNPIRVGPVDSSHQCLNSRWVNLAIRSCGSDDLANIHNECGGRGDTKGDADQLRRHTVMVTPLWIQVNQSTSQL